MKISDIEIINTLMPLAASTLPKPVGRNYGAFMLVRVRCDNDLEGWGKVILEMRQPPSPR